MRSRNPRKLRRVSILITEEQHALIKKRGLSLSGLVRDLLDDRFNGHSVVVALSEHTKRLYDSIISNFGAQDQDLEKYFLHALESLLNDKMHDLTTLRETIRKTARADNNS